MTPHGQPGGRGEQPFHPVGGALSAGGDQHLHARRGRPRSRSPWEPAEDPENWPHADLSGHVAAVVQAIAAALQQVMAERELSFHRLAELSGVNRQTVNDVAVGRCRPDVATIAQLEAGLSVRLWPVQPGGSGGS
ncbi:helix-turn-helix transcriptional regulator [Nonomuraea angiospora]|uniref:helix-turn-helix domain-containing protein n=1 Tax=Nonomuraea angiospora TaxID=46172 RepID=UPI0033D8A16C